VIDVSADFVGRFPELHRVAYRASFAVLGDRDEAQDCAQEALARALARWRSVAGHAVPWVARVATNLALDRARWLARRPSSSTSETEGRTPLGSATSDPFALDRHDLVVALRALPRRQRDAVVLRHLLGFSEQETAGAMGCSVGTVKSSTSRALGALRLALGPQWRWND
jgi:RNA polymerase sigma factor (sigma-70 family)